MTTNALAPAIQNTLTLTQFAQLAAMPPALEWFANIRNPNTRRAYENDVTGFCRFAGIGAPEGLRAVPQVADALIEAVFPWLISHPSSLAPYLEWGNSGKSNQT